MRQVGSGVQINSVIHNQMKYSEIYGLSKRFSPPEVDLRKARILDDYGDDRFATLPVSHQKPDDVKREEFDYYGWCYPFMGPEDLLFYLYPIMIEYEKDSTLDCLESFMYTSDRKLNEILALLTNNEIQILRTAYKIIGDIDGGEWDELMQCRNIHHLLANSQG